MIAMRSIAVATDVFAAIWSHRHDGEESEDQILRRLLTVPKSADQQTSIERREKVLWRDDVRGALERLGGSAALASIYQSVRETRRREGRKIPPSLDAIVRRELEYNSSDSESYTGRLDWFRSVEGLGAGIWALR